jgi:PhnB protein
MPGRLALRLSVHLAFDGLCEDAFRFYHQLLGGQLTSMLKYGDSPLADQTPPHLRDRIIHATLSFGTHELLGADVMPQDFEPQQGFSVMLNLPDPKHARVVFDSLSVGGKIRMPFQETFWSPGFGVVTDRFGTPWEINSEVASAEPAVPPFA